MLFVYWYSVEYINSALSRNLHINGMDELIVFLGSNPNEVRKWPCLAERDKKFLMADKLVDEWQFIITWISVVLVVFPLSSITSASWFSLSYLLSCPLPCFCSGLDCYLCNPGTVVHVRHRDCVPDAQGTGWGCHGNQNTPLPGVALSCTYFSCVFSSPPATWQWLDRLVLENRRGRKRSELLFVSDAG